MATAIRESDWKLFRQLHKVALERFCERAVGERPFVELDPTDHPLALDQRNGITMQRVFEIAESIEHVGLVEQPNVRTTMIQFPRGSQNRSRQRTGQPLAPLHRHGRDRYRIIRQRADAGLPVGYRRRF